MHAVGLLNTDREALRGAIEHFERSPRWPALASALEDLGVLSPREEAIELLGRALKLASKMGRLGTPPVCVAACVIWASAGA